MKKFVLFAFVSLSFMISGNAVAQGYLHSRDKLIVNGNGQEVQLRGMGLGGWMLQEGYMLKINKNGTQHEIRQRISDLIGPEDCERFYDLWHQNHMRKSDVDSLAAWGFNSIRLPMHYNLFTLPVELEPVAGENTWIQKGFDMTDSLVSWCRGNKIYLILDLHAAPGGQGKDANISDYDPSKPGLWESKANQDKTVALWRKLAEHYANEPWIGGYDLLNEPNWTFEGKNKNGQEDSLNTEIWHLYKQITAAIREVDKNHSIIIEGNGWGNNYRGFPGIWDNNTVMSFHKYWNPNTPESIAGFIKLRDTYKVPIWLGESGENADPWFTECIGLMENNHIGWSWWPLKKIATAACPLDIKMPEGYQALLDYWNKDGQKPSKETASKALFQLTENIKSENCFFVKDYVDAMFRQVYDTTLLPYNKHSVPCKIYATDFDLGRQGIAYIDIDPGNTGRRGNRQGNKGGAYRNDGVDIVAVNDSIHLTNGFYVTSMEEGEWMNYTLEVKKPGYYKISVSLSSEKSGGSLQILLDNKAISTIPVLSTGGNEKFEILPAGEMKLEAGKHEMNVLVVKGGFNLNYIEFLKK